MVPECIQFSEGDSAGSGFTTHAQDVGKALGAVSTSDLIRCPTPFVFQLATCLPTSNSAAQHADVQALRDRLELCCGGPPKKEKRACYNFNSDAGCRRAVCIFEHRELSKEQVFARASAEAAVAKASATPKKETRAYYKFNSDAGCRNPGCGFEHRELSEEEAVARAAWPGVCYRFNSNAVCKSAGCIFEHRELTEEDVVARAPAAPVKCTYCWKAGHSMADCRKRVENDIQQSAYGRVSGRYWDVESAFIMEPMLIQHDAQPRCQRCGGAHFVSSCKNAQKCDRRPVASGKSRSRGENARRAVRNSMD